MPHNPACARGNRADVAYQFSFRRDTSRRMRPGCTLIQAAHDVLLFGLRMTDLDAYHRQHRYQLWIRELASHTIYCDNTLSARLARRPLSERGSVTSRFVRLFFPLFDDEDTRSATASGMSRLIVLLRSVFCSAHYPCVASSNFVGS